MNTILRIFQSLLNRDPNATEDTRTVELSKIEGDPNHLRVTVRDKASGKEIYSYKFVVFNEEEVAEIKSLNRQHSAVLAS